MILLAIILLNFLFPEYTGSKGCNAILRYGTESEWTCVKKSKGIQLYERWVQINDSLSVRERKGELITSCTIEKAETYLRDYSTVTDWMKGVKSVNALTADSGQVVYMLIQLPWPFSNRDLVARYSYFRIDQEHRTVKVKSDNTVSTPDNRCVRIKHYEASWSLERLNERQTKIVFTTFSSEPPLFPQWIQEPVLKKLFINNLNRLRLELSQA